MNKYWHSVKKGKSLMQHLNHQADKHVPPVARSGHLCSCTILWERVCVRRRNELSHGGYRKESLSARSNLFLPDIHKWPGRTDRWWAESYVSPSPKWTTLECIISARVAYIIQPRCQPKNPRSTKAVIYKRRQIFAGRSSYPAQKFPVLHLDKSLKQLWLKPISSGVY